MRLIARIFCLIACFHMVGGHWAVLQGLAWTTMVLEYSGDSTFTEAVKKTFSGKAPCGMCHSISEQRSKEERSPAKLVYQKLGDVFLVRSENILPVREWSTHSYFHAPDALPIKRPQAPPVPVPIQVWSLA